MEQEADEPFAYDVRAPRRPVHLTLNADLLSRVVLVTPDLSTTVEHLLGRYLQAAAQLRPAEQGQLDDVIQALNGMHDQHGFLSDEFSTL